MMPRPVFVALILLVAAGALLFRLPELSHRPMHTDEAVQAVKAGTLLDTGSYTYDPREFHGPTLYYLTLPVAWLSGARSFAETDELTFRIVPVVFGVGLVLLLLLVGDGFGRTATVCVAAFTAISPAMVFYSRYYIQEMLLVFFTFGAIASGWRYVWTHRLRWAALAGLFLGLMQATKETWLLALGAMLLAVAAKVGWRRWWGYPIRVRTHLNPRHLALAAAAGLAVSILFYSSFFTNPQGPLDSVLAYANYLTRSDGAGLHDHPWHYYLKMLAYTHSARGPWWSEGLILVLALIGFAAVMLPTPLAEAHTPLVRFVAFYTLFLTAAYALVPYKTPWCMLGFLHGMILLAGVGAVVLVRLLPTRPGKVAGCLVLAAGAWQLGAQAYRASYRFEGDRRNPYVYAHTSSDLLNMADQVRGVARAFARLRAAGPGEMVIKIIAPDSDYWPLPWYLREFHHVGYWHAPPADVGDHAAVIIASAAVGDDLMAKLPDTFQFAGFFGLRPTVHLLVYVRKDLWLAFLEDRASRPPPQT